MTSWWCGRGPAASLGAVGLALIVGIFTAPDLSAQEENAAIVRVDSGGDRVRAAGAAVEVTGNAASILAAGARVTVDAIASGNILAAGADVSIQGAAGGSIRAAGSHLSVVGVAGARAWLAGGEVRVDLVTGSNLYLAGGKVTLAPGTDIGGRLSIAGGSVVIEGRVRGNARVAGETVSLNGEVDGTLTVAARRLVLGPEAIVRQDLVLMPGTEVDINPAAHIEGQTRTPRFQRWWSAIPGPIAEASLIAAIFMFAAAIVVGLGLLLLVRGSYLDAAARLRRMPVTSLIVGLVAVTMIPILAVLLAVTMIGIPLALLLLLTIPVMLLAGYAVAALGFADVILNRGGTALGILRTLLFLVVGSLLLAVVGVIPFAGGALLAIAVLVGAGAFLRVIWRRLRGPAAAPAA